MRPALSAACASGPSLHAVSCSDPASYKKLTMPVFVIWGDLDTITPLAQGERLAKITAGAELSVLKKVGRIPQIEDATSSTTCSCRAC
jgi:pimeloyl-ACP methyl ester carboxylesterase